ncbi:ArsR/SmtB family transcription factor [Halovenus halobia]|uniref:ArsR/SmtB family transcription factor n=1 Tax=Halovenus halobia TaxID=3396622 RepID=UPI003F548B38
MAMKLSATEQDRAEDSVETDLTLLELLGDEYTRQVLAAVTEQPRSGSEVVDAAEVSKATAYRRLDALEDAGLVDSEMVFDPDGHHHERFHVVVGSIDITFGDDGVKIAVEIDDEDSTAIPHGV